MTGDPAPPRLMPPTCCPFHASGGHWDIGHREQRVEGFYEVAHVGSEIPAISTEREWLAAFGDMWGYIRPCEALASRDPGRAS